MHSVCKRNLVIMMMEVNLMVESLMSFLRWQSHTFFKYLFPFSPFLFLLNPNFAWTYSIEFRDPSWCPNFCISQISGGVIHNSPSKSIKRKGGMKRWLIFMVSDGIKKEWIWVDLFQNMHAHFIKITKQRV